MNTRKWMKAAGTASLAATLLLAASAATVPSHAAAAAASEAKAAWNTIDLKNQPFTKNKVLYVPLKEISESLQLQLTVVGKNQMYINSPKESVRIKVGQARAVNAKGSVLKLEAAPVIKKGVTYVPASLITKAFAIPLRYDAKSGLATTFNPGTGYAYTAKGSMLFWVNRENGTLYMGKAGTVPVKAGKVSIENIDILEIDAHKVNGNTYVADIYNTYGEPHIHEARYRVLIRDQKIIKTAATQNANFAGINYEPNVTGYKGNIAMMNGSKLELVHPTGKTVKTYDLAALTGVKDDFTVEAIEQDFLLVRPYTKATLYIVNPTGTKAELIYPEILDEESIKAIGEMPPNEVGFIGDGLTFVGYKSGKLTLQYENPFLDIKNNLTYALPF
ncbi:copper amine oxidase N-terminal domain-containing protein [Paenibacillus lactis]|uniref:copper amine oxidase N-terminal domain-containing protein n=1 Tax=Paenibacillus lactis TaxID=228574 RepID=UPI001B13C25F|nr:copper amine oxidase N-terminal domain-containing protein [Paenibacillus lactis]GIO94421.1 hypothetical protein J31TS3_56480 [Paenibacillus lactis]